MHWCIKWWLYRGDWWRRRSGYHVETPRLTRKFIDSRHALSRRETGDKNSTQCPMESWFQDGPGTRAENEKASGGGGVSACR